MPSRRSLGSWQSFGHFGGDDSDFGSAPKSDKRGRRGKKPSRSFALKSEGDTIVDDRGDALTSLTELFGDVFDHDIIQSVLAAHAQDTDAAVQTLLEMANSVHPGNNAEAAAPSTRASTSGFSHQSTTTSNYSCHTPQQGVSTTAASSGPSYWDLLPADIRHLVLSHLPYAALAKAAATSTDFATRIQSLREKVKRVEVPSNSTMYSIEGMVASHTKATAVNLSRLAPSLKHCEGIRQVLVGLLRGLQSPKRQVPLMALSLNRIQVVTENEVQYICQELEQLRELDLSECQGVGDAALRCLARYRTGAPPASPAGISPPPATPPGLTSLNLARCDTISADGIKDLLSGPATRHSLQHLDVSKCLRLNKSAFHLPSNSALQVLRAGGCNSLTSLSIQLPPSAPLQELHLPFTPQLRHVLVVAPNLQLLNLSGCSRLQELNISCKNLLELNLAQATSLPTIQTTSCPRLHTLKLNSCRVLETLALQQLVTAAPALKHLDVAGCWLVSSLHLDLHPHLEVLNMRACTNLRSVSINSTALQKLDAASCGALASLVLEACPQQLLDLARCSSLAHLTIGSQGETAGGSLGDRVPGEVDATQAKRRIDIKGCSRLGGEVLELLARLRV